MVRCGLVVALFCTLAEAEPFDDSIRREIERFQSEFGERENAHGGMVIGLIDSEGTTILSCESKSVAGTLGGSTVFELGSVTKVFTALMALELERAGKWSLGDPVTRYLPDKVPVPAFGENQIRLVNLARQDSGLPWHPDEPKRLASGAVDFKEMRRKVNAFDTEDLYSFLRTFRLDRKPGEAFGYSNVGMALLAHAAGNATGKGFDALIEQYVSGPLGMSSTKVNLDAGLRERLVPGHWQNGETSENAEFKAMAGAGKLFSTVDDLLRFVSANLGLSDSELSPSLVAMQEFQHEGSPQFGKTATPWMTERVYQPEGSRLIGHGGGGFGYLAFVGLDTEQKRGVVVLSNQMLVHSSGVGWTILQQLPLTPYNVGFFVRRHVGVGFSLGTKAGSDEILVANVFLDSPAEKVGLPEASVIREINGTATAGKGISECLRLLGGETGDVVELKVLPRGVEPETTFRITCGPFLTMTGHETEGVSR
ncbi:MAG: serine hydrolase [Verrucomicrobiae bacterium]|nr:serine hydrolase [Verrucomicrobiae bacterium]